MTRRHASPPAVPWTKARIDALRLMAEEFIRIAMDERRSEDESAYMAILGGALVGFVPELLDEIERLRDAGRLMRGQVVKMDSRGGNA